MGRHSVVPFFIVSTLLSESFMFADPHMHHNHQTPASICALDNGSKPESWIELSSCALIDNIQLYRSIVPKTTKIGLVVKSNAYGHGMIEIARLVESHKMVDYFMVAQLTEALTLRNNGIVTPVMVLNPVRSGLELLFTHDIEPMVTDMDVLDALSVIAQQQKRSITVHIKIDTGLSRFGFHPDQLSEVVARANRLTGIIIGSIYTHFAESNNSDLSFTMQQYERFSQAIARLQPDTLPMVHMSNTAGITSIDDRLSSLVRLGAGAYGLWPSEQTRTSNWQPISYQHLKPVLSWKTTIAHCKTVPAGTFVGYNRTYLTTQATRIGIIPVGYYDGLDKRLSNKGVVRIDGQSASIIGTIGMNATMIDITHIPSASCDTLVTLIGNQPCITAADIAQQTGCFNARQITTALNPLINRILV